MKRAFVFSEGNTNKFWSIHYGGTDFAVNFGKAGTPGKYQIKEFDTEEECTKQAEKLIKQKLKKGYTEVGDFDYKARLYFDDEEFEIHPKTSHPSFVEACTDPLYYDCTDEEAPFGSDEGADALYELQRAVRKNKNLDFADFARHIIEDLWEMDYIPAEDLEANGLKALLDTNEMDVMQTDMVTYAVAFGQIKITGTIDEELRKAAVASLKRFNQSAKILGWGDSSVNRETMMEDLERFGHMYM